MSFATAGRCPGSRGPAVGNGPHPGHMGPCFVAAPYPLWCAPLPPLAAFCALRVPFCAGAPSPARVPFGAGRPPPLRGSGPAPSALPLVALPGPRPLPPAPPFGPCAPLCGSVGALWPRCASALPLLWCGLPVRSPFLRAGAARALRGFPAGSPLGPPPCASSLAPPFRAPVGLRARRLPARGLCGPSGRSGGLRPRAFPARGCRRLLPSAGVWCAV